MLTQADLNQMGMDKVVHPRPMARCRICGKQFNLENVDSMKDHYPSCRANNRGREWRPKW